MNGSCESVSHGRVCINAARVQCIVLSCYESTCWWWQKENFLCFTQLIWVIHSVPPVETNSPSIQGWLQDWQLQYFKRGITGNTQFVQREDCSAKNADWGHHDTLQCGRRHWWPWPIAFLTSPSVNVQLHGPYKMYNECQRWRNRNYGIWTECCLMPLG